ncbi:MAG: hypothetical protein IJ160_03805 [Muribaculaceae bacterium]|nr:hypothetical protein [Muribaculaceae bacterium]
MNIENILRIGDVSDNGQVTIVDEDRLCYLVKSESRGSVGLRTISKALLGEYVHYFTENPDSNANTARDVLCGKTAIDKFEYGYTSTLTVMAKMVIEHSARRVDYVTDKDKTKINLQQIFYGAPGTGKSHSIKDDAAVKEAEKKNLVFRTTFHPDSDYSTFVGAYKPTMKSSERIYTSEELTIKLKEIKTTGTTYPCHKFAAKYWESIKDLSPDSIKQILNACGFTDKYSVEVGKGVAIGQEYLNKPEDGKIIYAFCPQAFTNAYVEAWRTKEEVYLVIEEINRGNCAQIFGDLFQLLDRKNGVSEYPVEADADLQSYLQKVLSDTTRTDIPEDVKSGKKLMLPSNLYIWATMNTSDQSLFPIDSAFKRRWNWVYMPIVTAKEKWFVKVGDKYYSWTKFLNAINDEVLTDETAEDKHLGFYFCKATQKRNESDTEPSVITAETFVGKVLFYLWNDVFKVYGIPTSIGPSKDWGFRKFYKTDGNVNQEKVAELMAKLKIDAEPEPEQPNTDTQPE